MLEALACGTPAVLPRCAVFDELWAEKLPGDWRYEAHGEEPKRAVAIAEALACASCEKARVRMASNPVKASWADATNELLSQYEAAIEGNLPYRQELATITKIVDLGDGCVCGAGCRSHDLWVDPLPRLACSPAHPEVDESRLASAAA